MYNEIPIPLPSQMAQQDWPACSEGQIGARASDSIKPPLLVVIICPDQQDQCSSDGASLIRLTIGWNWHLNSSIKRRA